MLRFYIFLYFLSFTFPVSGQVHKIYVSTRGLDKNTGTLGKPFKTLKKALAVSANFSGGQVSIQLRGGTYYLPEAILIRSTEKLPQSLEIKAYAKEKVVLSAGRKLKTDWQLFKNGIYRASVPDDISFERLYVNGLLQTMARYPNADTMAGVFNGTAHDATYYMRVLTWGNPFGGYVHALDENKKGSLHYKITGVDDTDNVELDGGWQFRKPVHPDTALRFVENIFSELDVPGEWYFDKTLRFLYYFPAKNIDLSKAIVEVSNLKNSVTLEGTSGNPVRNVLFKDLQFCHNERTFMDSRETVNGSDWAVYKGGAILFTGTENCVIENCSFKYLGGNAIMFSGYNKSDTVANCLVDHIGASAVSLLENDKMENSVQVSITNNTVHRTGEIEKQGYGIHLSGAKQILIRGNKIDQVPGAAIKYDNQPVKEITSLNNTIFEEFREINPH